MEKATHSIWIIDALKAIASQLIVWHHFALYGPMAKVVHPYVSGLLDWLASDARLVVQAFLVIGGFLAARGLAPRPHQPTFDATPGVLMQMVWHRYLRLVRPYGIALMLAMAFAAIARQLLIDADTPAAPTLMQVLTHGLLLHDIIQVDALSAGVWYVAIDFQLYCIFLLMLWLSQNIALRCHVNMRRLSLLLIVGMSASSLLWFNRNPSMDDWAFYFFGAYSLGIMVQWSAGFTRKHPWLVLLAVLLVVALVLEWRSRLLVAMVTALILGAGLHLKPIFHAHVHGLLSTLGRISYSVFLIHYPVVLIVGALVTYLWAGDVLANAVGLVVAWMLSLWCGSVLYQRVERPRFAATLERPAASSGRS